jgi:C1A family cysteine protease
MALAKANISLSVQFFAMKTSYFVFASLIGLCTACGGGQQQSQSGGETAQEEAAPANPNLAQGCDLNQKLFDEALVYEPLAASLPENNSPGRVSLEQYAPRRLSQGRQGSCTAWATAYAATTILRSASTKEDPNAIAFSPSFVYNQITRGNCTGTHIGKTLEMIERQGLVGLQDFPYTDASCRDQPDQVKRQKASKNRIRGFNRLTLQHDDYKVDVNAIKQNIAQGAPVVIGMAVGGSFYNMEGKRFWKPTRRDFAALQNGLGGHIVDDGGGGSFGGHAMCVIGYDDNLEGGAFQIMNSWGEDWGERGLFWMRYQDFEYFSNSFSGEAYGLYPIPEQNRKHDFEAAIALYENQTKAYIPFVAKAGNVFATQGTLKAGTKFKVAVKNAVACYTYVIGQETDGSSYVLFPYTEKHSPYLGIVGSRLFPKDYSLQLDDKGTKDVMAVIFSKEPLDLPATNAKISQSRKPDYAGKIAEALGSTVIAAPNFSVDGGKISFRAESKGKNTLAVVFEINKGR